MPVFYDIFPIDPDFTDKVSIGEASKRSNIAVAMGATAEARWPTESTRTASATITLRGPTQIRLFREFIFRIRGKWQPFQWPSWTRDFRARFTSTTGQTTIRVERNFSEFMGDDTPDAAGRNIWCYTPGRTLWIGRVVAAVDNGELSTITVTPPLPFSEDLTRCIFGFCWFARIADDEVSFEHMTPDRAKVKLGIVEARNQQDREADQPTTGIEIYESKALTRAQEFAVRPELSVLLQWQAIGPEAYATPQAQPYSSTWYGSLDTTGAKWIGPGETRYSTLWDGGADVEHINGGFDVLGRDALVWQHEAETIRLRWHNAGTPQALNFTGRSPVMFQNWAINGEISGGEADLIVYYLKAGEGKIYARAQRDSFAIEYIACASPVMPLWLTRVRTNAAGDRIWVEGMTACHNLGRWVSDLYIPPIPPIRDTAGGTISPLWVYVNPTRELQVSGDTASGGVASISGIYAFGATIRDRSTSEDTSASVEMLGSYLNVQVDSEEIEDETLSITEITGEAVQNGRDAGYDDETTTTISITGAYEN